MQRVMVGHGGVGKLAFGAAHTERLTMQLIEDREPGGET